MSNFKIFFIGLLISTGIGFLVGYLFDYWLIGLIAGLGIVIGILLGLKPMAKTK